LRTCFKISVIAPWLILMGCPLRGGDPKQSASATAYLYATTTCIGGNGGPGVRLFLKQFTQCQGRTSYPYLRIEIREQPILTQKNIVIGGDNSAIRCLSARQSCEQAISGKILFDHFEQFSGKEVKTDGHYDLEFKNGKVPKSRVPYSPR